MFILLGFNFSSSFYLVLLQSIATHSGELQSFFPLVFRHSWVGHI